MKLQANRFFNVKLQRAVHSKFGARQIRFNATEEEKRRHRRSLLQITRRQLPWLEKQLVCVWLWRCLTMPKAKVAATRDYGAEIIFYDRHKEDREKFALDLAERERLVMVPPYDDELIMAGQATCGLELLEDVPDLDCLLAPCSGGGLFAGVASAAKEVKPDIKLFPVEPDTADDTKQSFDKGERVSIPPPPTIADGLRVQVPGRLTFPIVQKLADDVLTVSDEEILATIKFMLFRMKLLVEPSGVAAAAAVMFQKLPADVKKIGVILSGGNIDTSVLAALISDPQAAA
jgi:threonine dehydratase